MTYRQRVSLFIFIDSCTVLTAIFLSRLLVDATTNVITFPIVLSSIVILISHHIFSLSFHLYKKAWEYASIGELISILKAVTFSILIAVTTQLLITHKIQFRLLFVTWLLNMSIMGGSRFCWRMFRDFYLNEAKNKKRTLIVGAGSAGTMVARQLNNNHGADLIPVGFIDDDEKNSI